MDLIQGIKKKVMSIEGGNVRKKDEKEIQIKK